MTKPEGALNMSRMVSFLVLVGVLVAIAVLFFKVMAGFILPLFMAVLLVVMFRPLHEWFCQKLAPRRRLAAAATTVSILLIFLVPMLVIFLEAGRESMALWQQDSNHAAQTGKRVDKAQTGEEVAGKEQRTSTVLADKLADKLKKLQDDLHQRFGIELPKDSVKTLETDINQRLQEWIAPMLLVTTRYAVSLVIGLVIMIVALYYFLLDGSKMINTVMRLSPLDNRYEWQLIEEFDRTSRAVVLAAVVSAVVQGILAGIGYYLAGLEIIFILTVLTMLLAMVPFVGAAAVWIPCSIWLLWEGHTTAAILLALYGLLVVSLVDNIIKPAILHGRSNLHPLLALLSVLGGVKALGPIGIFVGPMAVTFLHALLVMVHKEIDLMGDQPPADVLTNKKSNKWLPSRKSGSAKSPPKEPPRPPEKS